MDVAGLLVADDEQRVLTADRVFLDALAPKGREIVGRKLREVLAGRPGRLPLDGVQGECLVRDGRRTWKVCWALAQGAGWFVTVQRAAR